MKHPHPLLALAARGAGVLGAGYLLAGVALTLLPAGAGPGARWYGRQVLDHWAAVRTAGQAWSAAYQQAYEFAAATAAPLGWLVAAGLLRLAAVGRLALVGPPRLVRVARPWAWVGMGLGLLAGGLGAVRWVEPDANSHLVERVRDGIDEGRTYQTSLELVPGATVTVGAYGFTTVDPTSRLDHARRVATLACTEAALLGRTVRFGAVLFCLCGVAYCLGRPHPDAP